MNDGSAMVMDAFGLDAVELRALLGDDLQDRLDAMVVLAELLGCTLGAGRLADVVRRPAAGYCGQTMLDLIAAGLHHELLASVRRSFERSAHPAGATAAVGGVHRVRLGELRGDEE